MTGLYSHGSGLSMGVLPISQVNVQGGLWETPHYEGGVESRTA